MVIINILDNINDCHYWFIAQYDRKSNLRAVKILIIEYYYYCSDKKKKSTKPSKHVIGSGILYDDDYRMMFSTSFSRNI